MEETTYGPDWLLAGEVAKELEISKSTVDRLGKVGTLVRAKDEKGNWRYAPLSVAAQKQEAKRSDEKAPADDGDAQGNAMRREGEIAARIAKYLRVTRDVDPFEIVDREGLPWDVVKRHLQEARSLEAFCKQPQPDRLDKLEARLHAQESYYPILIECPKCMGSARPPVLFVCCDCGHTGSM